MVADGPLSTYPGSGMAHKRVPATTPLLDGVGYWAFFDTPMTEMLPTVTPRSLTLPLAAGQYTMIGNPGDTPANIVGPDAIYVYDSTSGYAQATMLQAGQGAWARS